MNAWSIRRLHSGPPMSDDMRRLHDQGYHNHVVFKKHLCNVLHLSFMQCFSSFITYVIMKIMQNKCILISCIVKHKESNVKITPNSQKLPFFKIIQNYSKLIDFLKCIQFVVETNRKL